MSDINKSSSRRINDIDIINLNNVGISLKGIGTRLGCHHTTVTARLKELDIPPTDTRRAFMEDIFESLTPIQQEWLISRLGPNYSIKDLIKSLLVKDYVLQK